MADLAAAKAKYPSCSFNQAEWLAFFDTPAGHHAMGRIIGDIYSEVVVEEEKAKGIRRTGRRPRPQAVDWRTVYRAVFPPQYSTEPFPKAFAELLKLRGMSIRAFGNKVPIHYSTLSRLLNGRLEPDLATMEIIAKAARVPPGFFVEWRAQFVAGTIARVMVEQPHVGISVFRNAHKALQTSQQKDS